MSLIQRTIVETPFCFANISFPFNCTDLVLYSKFPYGSQFSAEKNGLKFRCLVLEIYCKNQILILLDIFYFYDFLRFRLKFFKSIVRKKFPINLFTVFFFCSHFSNIKRGTYPNLHAILDNLYPVQGQCALSDTVINSYLILILWLSALSNTVIINSINHGDICPI